MDIFYFKKLNKLKSHGISSKHSGKLFRFKLSVKKNPAINFRTKFSAISFPQGVYFMSTFDEVDDKSIVRCQVEFNPRETYTQFEFGVLTQMMS